MKFLKKGLLYGKERVRVFCTEFYVVYTMPPNTLLLTEKRTRGNGVKQQGGYMQNGKKLDIPVFGLVFAV